MDRWDNPISPNTQGSPWNLELRPIESSENPQLPCREIESSFLQSSYWGRLKSRFGWQAYAFSLRIQEPGTQDQHQDQTSTYLLVLVRTLAPGVQIAYLPHGPSFPEKSKLQEHSRQLAEFLKVLGVRLQEYVPKSVIALRFDPDWEFTLSKDSTPAQKGPVWNLSPLRKGRIDIQPPVTGIIHLSSDPETLLESFKSKHRYNIRLSQKKGVEFKAFSLGDPAFDSQLQNWYQLYQETAKRDGILIHSLEYYQQVAHLFPTMTDSTGNPENQRKLVLFQAFHQEDYLAGIIVVFWNQRATYLYGASSNTKRNLMPAYGLQWEAMQEALRLGCQEYDLFGMPPTPEPDHPMFGLFQFKAGFLQDITYYPGTWDFITRPLVYRVYIWGENLRARLIRFRKKIQSPLSFRTNKG